MLPTFAAGAGAGGGWRGDERPLNEVVSVTCGRLIGSSSHHRCHQVSWTTSLTQPHVRTAFPKPIQPTCSRSCAPIGPLRATTGSIMLRSWMPSQSAGRLADAERPTRGSTSPSSARSNITVRAIDDEGAPEPPGPLFCAAGARSAAPLSPRTRPAFRSNLLLPTSSHAFPPARLPPACGYLTFGDPSTADPKKLGGVTRPKRCALERTC